MSLVINKCPLGNKSTPAVEQRDRDGLAQVEQAVLEMQTVSQDGQVRQHCHTGPRISVTSVTEVCFFAHNALASEKLAWASIPYHLQLETKDEGTASI